MWLNAKRNVIGLISLTFSKEESFTWSQKTYLAISALAAVMCMENKRKHFQAVVFRVSTHTLIQPYAVKLEETLPNTIPCVCPAGVSDREITWTKEAWPWRSLKCAVVPGKILAGCKCSLWGSQRDAHYSFSIRISAVSFLRVTEPCSVGPNLAAMLWCGIVSLQKWHQFFEEVTETAPNYASLTI